MINGGVHHMILAVFALIEEGDTLLWAIWSVQRSFAFAFLFFFGEM